ncbi:hypothetical protein GCM10011352_39200 [Marinobacterium zhoushanense]|uniref:Resolvase/invertase-type recombinase catalytic domain-containing protein n=1 Tax=Marinobacterium zhoushanense TaxID=1679163 RepID=A0ABQ1KSL8_9GAMM|nr:recombinase family protein [Marinobacterium zhoushanense]GGC08982.1 hypothetical protein GCM10011352_39200 [Marinobacterium zhoushanense]
MKKVIYPYVRFSSNEQGSGDSLRRQLKAIRSFAEQNGYEINESLNLTDLGISAYKGDNLEIDAGLGRFILAINKGLIPLDGTSFICVEQLDRLTRKSVSQAYLLFSDILRKNVNIITLMDNRIYTKKSLDNLPEIIYSLTLMEQSHIESAKKSERVKAAFHGRLSRIKNGQKAKYASQIPSWLDEEKPKSGVFKINDKADIIIRIFQMTIENIPLNEIARILNREGIERITRSKYKNATNVWTGSVISHIIKNRCVIGNLDIYKTDYAKNSEGVLKRVRYLDETIEDYYPAIITNNDFVIANARVKERKVSSERGRTTNKNLFTSLIYCGECHSRMHFEIDKKTLSSGVREYKSLKCTNQRHGGNCTAIPVKYDNFEKEFPLKYFMRDDASNSLNTDKINKIKEELNALEADHIRQQDKISKIEKSIVEDDLDITAFLKTISTLKSDCNKKSIEIERLRFQLAGLEAARSGKTNKSLLSEEDRSAVKRRLKSLLSGIIIYSKRKVAWVILRDGTPNAFKFERDGNLLDNMSEYIKLVDDIRKSYTSGNLDPKLEKLARALMHGS